MSVYKLTLPVSHIVLWDSPDALTLVKANRTIGAVKRGFQYLFLAVNNKGLVAVGDPSMGLKLVENPETKWFPMDAFEWCMDPDGQPLRYSEDSARGVAAANDN